MRITRIESLHADGGWRPFSFLKISTDQGLTGWSEYSCGRWSPALPQVIDVLGQSVMGRNPCEFNRLSAELHAMTRFTAGGLAAQGIAAIENACIDIAAKAVGVPVHVLFGGKLREHLPLYWSHCGSFRPRDAAFFERVLECPPLENLDDVKRLGEEAVARGYAAAKINPILFGPQGPTLFNPGFVPQGLELGRTIDAGTLAAIERQVEAFTDGTRGNVAVLLDINFGFTPEAAARLGQVLARFDLKWLEYDVHDPAALADVRAKVPMSLASLESIYGRRGYRPYFEARAADIAVIDVLWNGLAESVRVANLAEAHDVNVAPHNFYGPIGDLMSAHFCAVVPNFEIMEFEGDDVPWKYDLVTVSPPLERGMLVVPDGPGWGAEVNEAAVAEHPWTGST